MATLTQFNSLVSEDVLAAQLQGIIVEYETYKQQQRRSETRESFSIPVQATPLDEHHVPIGEPFNMVTRDMSTRGVGAFHDKLISHQFLYLEFHSPVTRNDFGVIARVEHCTPCGKYFIVGCQFLTQQPTTETEQ